MFRNRRWASLIALFLPLALVAAACGDDDDAGETTDTTADNGGDDGAGEGGGESASGLPECLDFADLYALTGPEADGITNWADAQELATELGSTTELPDTELTVAGPCEDSGTYESYVELGME